MRLTDYIDLNVPGPSTSKAIQVIAEDNWSYFGKDHGPRTSIAYKLKTQGRMNPVDPQTFKSGARL